ncbi:MAG: coproporphyrinogen III oxidase family protein [Gammaproteobacteria bacterium]|nr:coproporphyrinogen III oxidase family protein [Gammaproteobacteria bacterium]MDH4314171.1 coproporphyrinogen III oxidase family protein [Gammaproteobacteria bacterium]MDH5212811.1 coproporphyrinogen III oxidase family protein [Gammaproteobacteria bacterium]MDH5500203.1 coproporphyrinogen III oxidase family protein [Gammaproteobacteria bacterium]
MSIASLLSWYFRRSSRRYMRFDGDAGITHLPMPRSDRQYLLYLHIPFCIVLCPFCSFHRVEFREDRATRYFQALRREIEKAGRSGFCFSELYVGGGTPTVLPDELIATVRMVRDQHPVARVSVETNPDDLENDSLPRMRDAGVNRLSVGVQSFDDKLLKEMQRYDKYGSSERIRTRLKSAKGLFDTLNVDMIFNFPHQTRDMLKTDLQILTEELGVDQISFYPLMSAKTTRKAMRKDIGEVTFDRERTFYELIAGHMQDAGYMRSSAWCFSRVPSMIDEYITEHEEYLGLGSGAFSYLDGSLYASTFSINHYLSLIDSGESGIVRRSGLSRREQMRYYLLMQLFSGSLDKAVAEQRFGGGFQRTVWAELVMLQSIGAVRNTGVQLVLTESGYYLWVMMMREFFTGVNNLRDQMRHNIARETTIPG